jgi:hypothetical protein
VSAFVFFLGVQMKTSSPGRQRLAAISLLGLPLLTYPMLGLPTGSVADIPAGFIYLFGIWAGLIGLAGWIAERRGK